MEIKFDYGNKNPERKKHEFGGDFHIDEVIRTDTGFSISLNGRYLSEDGMTEYKRTGKITISAQEIAEVVLVQFPTK